jgi:ankyrin repeat protein
MTTLRTKIKSKLGLICISEGQDFISSTDLEGSTALHWAVLGGEIKCIQHLLEHGAAVDWIPFKVIKYPRNK